MTQASKKLQPMLAEKAPADLSKLTYPLLASPKLDGIRCLIKDGVALSRTLKRIPNQHIQSVIGRLTYEGFDGEITVGSPTSSSLMQTTMSAVMSRDGEPDFAFRVFDNWMRTWEYVSLAAATSSAFNDVVIKHPQTLIHSAQDLEAYEADIIAQGYEGVITRLPESLYKFGRSTAKQQWLLKLKRYAQDEAVVTGVEPLRHNANDPETDERGYTKRSSHQDNKIPVEMLGALRCELLGSPGVKFNLGTGFTEAERRMLWGMRDGLIGRTVSFKHFKQAGVKIAPRHPVFVSFRDVIDL